MAEVKVQVSKSGPILIRGPVDIVDGDGNALPVTPGQSVALCRCGHSSKKPFCDGSHRKVGFVE